MAVCKWTWWYFFNELMNTHMKIYGFFPLAMNCSHIIIFIKMKTQWIKRNCEYSSYNNDNRNKTTKIEWLWRIQRCFYNSNFIFVVLFFTCRKKIIQKVSLVAFGFLLWPSCNYSISSDSTSIAIGILPSSKCNNFVPFSFECRRLFRVYISYIVRFCSFAQ